MSASSLTHVKSAIVCGTTGIEWIFRKHWLGSFGDPNRFSQSSLSEPGLEIPGSISQRMSPKMHPILSSKKRARAPGPRISANRSDVPVQKGWEDHSAEPSGKLTDERHQEGPGVHVHIFHIFAYFLNICSRPPRSRSVAGSATRRQASPRALGKF